MLNRILSLHISKNVENAEIDTKINLAIST